MLQAKFKKKKKMYPVLSLTNGQFSINYFTTIGRKKKKKQNCGYIVTYLKNVI